MGESKFTGGLAGLWGMRLLSIPVFAFSLFTLGFLSAWYSMFFQRWMARHTYVDGYQLQFVGKTVEFWVQRLIWSLLIGFTLLLYLILGFFTLSKKRWFAKRTHFAQQTQA